MSVLPEIPAPEAPAGCIDCRELHVDADKRAYEADLVRLVVLHGPERVYAMDGFSRRELGRAMTLMQRHAYSLHCLMHEDADGYDRLRDDRLEAQAHGRAAA